MVEYADYFYDKIVSHNTVSCCLLLLLLLLL
jgi:hypothetical protein